MKVECCYCHKSMGEKMGPDNLVTSGICRECLPRAYEEAGIPLPTLSEAAAILGRKGGSSRSEAKGKAVRENGKKGGRPMGSKDKKPRKKGGITLLVVLLLASCSIQPKERSEYWEYNYDCGFTPLSIDQLQWWIRTNVEYGYDIDQYGEEEYWASPEETMSSKLGDCEDMAILFGYMAYKTYGYEPTFVILSSNGNNHMAVSLDKYPNEYFMASDAMCSWEVVHTFNYGQTMWIACNTHNPNVR